MRQANLLPCGGQSVMRLPYIMRQTLRNSSLRALRSFSSNPVFQYPLINPCNTSSGTRGHDHMQTIAFCVQRRVKHGYMLQINISIMHLLAVIYSWTLLRDGTSVEQYTMFYSQ